MPYPNMTCLVCGSGPNEKCYNLRTGKPTKYFHKNGRVVRVKTTTTDSLLKGIKQASQGKLKDLGTFAHIPRRQIEN